MFIAPKVLVSVRSLPHHPKHTCEKQRRTGLLTACASPPKIWVCTGPSCKTDGSSGTIDVLNAISPPTITACPTGCLGECGSGPNATATSASIAIPTITKRLRTAHAVKNFLNSVGCDVNSENFDAAQRKEAADAQLQKGDAPAAAKLYAEAATVLQHTGSLYISTLCNWSAALLQSGLSHEALDIANSAVDSDASRPAAWRRKAQAHEACKQIDSAISAWTMAGRLSASGDAEEARRNVQRLKRPRFLRF